MRNLKFESERDLKVKLSDVLDLPYLTVVYDAVSNNKIMVTHLQATGADVSIVRNGYSDEESVNNDVHKSLDVGQGIHHNIRCLVNDVYDKFVFVAVGEDYANVLFDPIPQVTTRMIDKSYETVYDTLVNAETSMMDTIMGYFQTKPPDSVVEQLFAQPLRQGSAKTGSNKTKQGLPKAFKLDYIQLKVLIEKEKKSLIETKLVDLPVKVREICNKGMFPTTDVSQAIPAEAELLRAIYGQYIKIEE